MRKPCCEKQETHKGAWTKQEDQKLIDYIRRHGNGCWRSIAQAAGLLRCGKSCRLRWINYLRPDIKRGNFSEDEEDLIIKLHALLGNRWSLIAGRLPGRTDNEVKNYWNSHLRRRLISMGIDPSNHKLPLIQHKPCPPMRTTSSFESRNQECQPNPPSKTQLRNDEASDATSYLEDTRSVPDLNIELTLSTPPCPILQKEEAQREEPKLPGHLPEAPSSATLLLFR